MIWREKRPLLMFLGLLLAANTIFFFTYRVQYENRLDALQKRLAAAETRQLQARAARANAERKVANHRQTQRDIHAIYTEHWATQDERLANLIDEVKRLAVASQLIPRTYSFTETQPARRGSKLALGATEVSISFTVAGNYQQVRRLVNLLELSEQFVIIDAIGLSAATDQSLTLNLKLKTLFRDDQPMPVARSRQS